jgi:hypothetical protein
MAYPSAYDAAAVEMFNKRIDSLNTDSKPLWGKMNAAQMLAHCNVAYEMTFESIHPKPNALMRFILRSFLKEMVCGEKPYKKGGQSAPAFIIKDERQFEKEKNRIKEYMKKVLDLGATHFEGKESASFGKLTAKEWSIMFSKHLDYHLLQFGV